jgi:hypothetical protein
MQEYTTKVIEQWRQQGLIAPNLALDPNPDPEPSTVDLVTSSSDELSDPPITQVETDNESKAQSNNEVIPSSHPLEASTSIQVPATAPTLTRSSTCSRKHTRKFESQHARDIVVIEAKEQRRKQREAKANRTGTGRTKAAEALAQTSQLLDGVELPFRSSQ